MPSLAHKYFCWPILCIPYSLLSNENINGWAVVPHIKSRKKVEKVTYFIENKWKWLFSLFQSYALITLIQIYSFFMIHWLFSFTLNVFQALCYIFNFITNVYKHKTTYKFFYLKSLKTKCPIVVSLVSYALLF